MNDTESRLRDYLDTKAATIPANDQGPGLLAETTHRRPVWPMLATAAAVAAVLALTVTGLTHLNADKADPAGRPAPLTDAAPKVPYTITTGVNAKGTVYDGTRTVRLPKELTPVEARVAGGWLTSYFVQNGPTVQPHVGILKTDGSFQRLGPKQALSPILSPDGKQVAMTTYPTKSARVVVHDLASGAEVASIPLPPNGAGATSWNKNGIWLDSGDPFSTDRLYLWKPGEKAARSVQVPKGYAGITTTPDSDIVVVSTRPQQTAPKKGETFKNTTSPEPTQNQCLQIGVLRGSAIEVQREHCEQAVLGLSAVLSPDGKKVVNTTSKLTIDVATGKTTKLDVPDRIENAPRPVFEDATKVLLVSRAEDATGPQRLFRCEITTGECKLLRTEKSNQITLARP
ncbi:hypothetical protein ACIA49_12250 [Kribbella sp. NPDC051587]|uniref:hypothetical protein n=1 Tax=Kribbella sp. NPDC051587 TaxID=3364119 RepID=UPI0037A6D173